MSTKLAAQFMGEMIGQQNRSRVSLKSKIHNLYAHIVIWYLKSTMIIQKMSSTALDIIGRVPLGPGARIYMKYFLLLPQKENFVLDL